MYNPGPTVKLVVLHDSYITYYRAIICAAVIFRSSAFSYYFSNKISQMTGLQLDKNISGQSHECSLRSNDDYSNFLSFTILDSY